MATSNTHLRSEMPGKGRLVHMYITTERFLGSNTHLESVITLTNKAVGKAMNSIYIHPDTHYMKIPLLNTSVLYNDVDSGGSFKELDYGKPT